MIWLTWRQFRAQAVTAAAALAAFATLLAITEPRLASLYTGSGFAGCHGGGCAGLANAFLGQLSNATPFGGPQGFRLLPAGTNLYVTVYAVGLLLILIAPAITGVFWGAPLIARELETGTSRLTWNQSVTRTRWLTVKLALVGAAAMAVTEAFSLLRAWWAAPISRATDLGGSVSVFSGGRFSPFVFATGGIAPLGYAAFGFALGVTAGLLIRRAVPAMALTLAVFAAVQVVVPLWVRPHLFPPDAAIAAVESAHATFSDVSGAPTLSANVVPGQPGAWILASGPVNAAGQPVAALPAACGPASGSPTAGSAFGSDLGRCLAGHGIREAVSYQPVSHYWPLQLVETGIFLALAVALAGFCLWRLGPPRQNSRPGEASQRAVEVEATVRSE
jgi:hypothetical protein